MATIPTDEEMGLQILTVFEERNLRAGGYLPAGVLLAEMGERGCREDDSYRGLKWLVANGHVDEIRRGYVLTAGGFALL